MKTNDPVLSFRNVDVRFSTEFGDVHAVKNVSFDIFPGEVVALVGESGSGKSVTSATSMGLLPTNATVNGEVFLSGENVVNFPAPMMRALRGRRIAMIFQEPMTALNPVLTVGDQIMETLAVHGVAYGKAARQRAIELLEMVGIESAASRIKHYPHQFSGGQRQRIVIAMALSCSPEVIIADEPTTALDVTVQAEILDLLRHLKETLSTAILLITHNMGVVADLADRVCVMLHGELIEEGSVEAVMNSPRHEYTQRLLEAVPRLGAMHVDTRDVAGSVEEGGVAREKIPVIKAENISIAYEHRGKKSTVVHDVSFQVASGEIVGLVGESGSGKSTIAKSVLGLLPITQGSMTMYGKELGAIKSSEMRALRKKMGVVFQDPAASLDPRFPIGDIISEPMLIHSVGDKKSRREKVYELLDAVQLPRDVINRYPHELSGGQRQRISIARALALDPVLLIADEPTSALDVSVQAAVLDMFAQLQSRYEFACLFVSHDLAVVEKMAHRVLVLKDGRVVEQGPVQKVLHTPQEIYTQTLLDAVPIPDPGLQRERRLARK